jgi:plastocyanin
VSKNRLQMGTLLIIISPDQLIDSTVRTPLLPAIALAALASVAPARAADAEALLIIKDHRFVPAEVKVPAGQRVKLIVHNQDPTPEEFESRSLSREKVIPAGAKATIYIGPLKAGRYTFAGEYNEATAKGTVVAE